MSIPSHRDPFSPVVSEAAGGHSEAHNSSVHAWDQFVEKHWQEKLQCLQEWICELLIKNQQLRMTLMEMQTRESESGSVGNT